MLYPAVMFGTCFILNFFILGKHSSGAVSNQAIMYKTSVSTPITVFFVLRLVNFMYGNISSIFKCAHERTSAYCFWDQDKITFNKSGYTFGNPKQVKPVPVF